MGFWDVMGGIATGGVSPIIGAMGANGKSADDAGIQSSIDAGTPLANAILARNAAWYGNPNAPATYRDSNGNIREVAGGSLGERNSALEDPNSTDSNRLAYGGRAGAADEDVGMFRQNAANFENRGGVNADFANALQSRNSQQDALGMYRDAAMGRGPSAAQMQFQQALQQQQAEQASLAASARGGGLARAAAQRLAMQNSAGMGQQSAAASAALRAQEQRAAMQGYAGLAGAIRGQDAQQALGQAGLEDAQRARNDQMYTSSMGMGQDVRAAQQQAGSNAENLINNTNATAAGVGSSSAATGVQQQQNDQRWVQGGVGAAASLGSLIALSDERAKTDVRSGERNAEDFLDALKARDYRYRDPSQPGASGGEHTSVMAQDLEKSEMGRRMVRDTPTGKQVDYREGFASMLAAMATMNHKVSSLESALAARTGRKAA